MAGRYGRFAERKPTKRDRERRIQGWFDPENPSHHYVIDMLMYFRERGLSESQFIERAVFALGEQGGAVPMPLDKTMIEVRLSQLQDQMQSMYAMLEQAALTPRTVIEYRESRMPELEEISPVEEGVAIGYNAFIIEIDEDEE